MMRFPMRAVSVFVAMALLVCGNVSVAASAQTAPQPGAESSTVTSDTALVGWAAGTSVNAELDDEKSLMRVPSGANAMEIERHISSLPHRAGSPVDHATALYVAQRLQQDGFA